LERGGTHLTILTVRYRNAETLKNAVQISANFVVCETDDLDADAFERFGSNLIISPTFRGVMLRAVQFNHES
jgi:hypothetical protein